MRTSNLILSEALLSCAIASILAGVAQADVTIEENMSVQGDGLIDASPQARKMRAPGSTRFWSHRVVTAQSRSEGQQAARVLTR